MKIIFSDFAHRQTRESRFSHFERSDDELISRVEKNFDRAVQGYKSGVLLVPIDDVSGFFSSTCALQPGDRLVGSFKPRREGEAPRKQVGVVGGQKQPARRVDVVLYSRDVLAENNEGTPLQSECFVCRGRGKSASRAICTFCQGSGNDLDSTPVFADFEIVSINCGATDDPEPMTIGTLLANHFHKSGSNDGGTSTGLTNDQLIEKLRESYDYWSDKATVAEEE